jgi:hypothetical protein
VYLKGVYLMRIYFIDMCLMACISRHVSHGPISYGCASHGRASHGRIPHGRASHVHVPHGRASREHVSHGHISCAGGYLMSVHLTGVSHRRVPHRRVSSPTLTTDRMQPFYLVVRRYLRHLVVAGISHFGAIKSALALLSGSPTARG